jgi:hypothetical protein
LFGRINAQRFVSKYSWINPIQCVLFLSFFVGVYLLIGLIDYANLKTLEEQASLPREKFNGYMTIRGRAKGFGNPINIEGFSAPLSYRCDLLPVDACAGRWKLGITRPMISVSGTLIRTDSRFVFITSALKDGMPWLSEAEFAAVLEGARSNAKWRAYCFFPFLILVFITWWFRAQRRYPS